MWESVFIFHLIDLLNFSLLLFSLHAVHYIHPVVSVANLIALDTCEMRLQRQTRQALFSIFIEKRLLRWDSNPPPPAFKAVTLPTEPLR